MATLNNWSYSDMRNLNVKGSSAQGKAAAIRFATIDGGVGNPFSDAASYGLYVNASGQLVFVSTSTSTVLGAAGGGGGASSWDAIYQNDTALAMAGAALTFDRTSGNQAVFTLTNTGAGSGNVIQVTNVGTGKDINGTSSTWSFDKTGINVMKSTTIAGTAASDSLTLTAGDVVISDGSITLTDADDAASFSVTNNSAATASMVVIAGSGTFTGSTTTSFMTITPSGLTTGTAVYLPVAALSTGKALHIVYGGTTSATSGILVHVTSSATAMTSTGRMLMVDHTGITGVSNILSEFKSAAGDETVILKVTATSTLLAGVALQVSGTAITTGKGISAGDLDSLTSGIGLNIVSASTALTGAGRLVYISHSGTSTSATTAKIVEIASAATEDTEIFKVTASDTLIGGLAVNISAAAMTTGTALNFVDMAALTSGIGIAVASSATAITGAGRLLFVNHTGATTSTGIIAEIKTAATDAANATTVLKLTQGATIVGVGLSVVSTTGLTTGSLIRATTSTAGALATNGAISFSATGNYTSNAVVDGGFVEVKANTTAAGTIVNVVGTSLTTGVGLVVSNGTSGITSGSLIRVTASGTGTVATNGIVSITHGGIFVSTSNAGVLDVRATAMVGTASNGTLVNFMTTAASQVDTTVLNVENSGFLTGYTGSMLRIKSVTTTGACRVVDLIADGITSGGTAMKISVAALTTGTALLITNGTSGITSGSLISVTASGTGTIATTGVVSFAHAGVYASTSNAGFVNITANATTAGTVLAVNATGLVDGIAIFVPSAEAGLTSGKYLSLGGKFTVAKFGATVITGSALGTAALTLTNGDILASAGSIKSASATGGIGYGTGAGSTVTQLTNRSTGVAINAVCGTITTDTTSLAAEASAEFVVTNTAVGIGDVIILSQRSGSSSVAGVAGTTIVNVVTVAAGSFTISVSNQSTTTAETGAIIINFAVIKAVTS